MRLLALPVLTLLVTACSSRADMSAVPNRRGHAFDADGGTSAVAGARSAPAEAAPRAAKVGPLQAGERYVTVGQGERLYQVAERERVDLWWLITRNDITAPPPAGQRLIVR